MGAATSSNTAEAIADVASSISSMTSTTQSQINRAETKIKLFKCNFGKDVNIKEFSQFVAKNEQIVQAFQQSNVQNNIAQKMMQQAQSKVGALGVGFAQSSNYASTFASTTSDVTNSVFTQSSQGSFFSADIVCDGSTIKGDFNIDVNSSTDFWNKQGVKSSQITDIANTIDQDISQTAKSTVQGIAGALIGMLAIVAALIYAVGSPLAESISAFKIVIAMFILFGVLLLVVWLWLIDFSPFFSEMTTCATSGSLLKDTCSAVKCKNPTLQTINIKNPPLKYMYNILSKGAPRSFSAYGMLNMMIYKNLDPDSARYNQGFNAYQCNIYGAKGDITSWAQDKSFSKINVPQLPNPLYIPKNCSNYAKDDPVRTWYCLVPDSFIVTNGPSDSSEPSNTPSVAMSKDSVKSVSPDDYAKYGKDAQIKVIAELNDQVWDDYLNVKGKYSSFKAKTIDIEKKKRVSHARFVLSSFLELDNNVFIFSGQDGIDEEVDINGEIMLASEAVKQNKGYIYDNFVSPPFGDYSYGIRGSGTLHGMIGICDSNKNKVNKFFKHIGNYIAMIIVFVIILILFYFSVKVKK
jgi:hypothetical protein